MFPVEVPVAKTLSGDVHGPQRVSQGRIETSPVAAHRERIRHRRYTGCGVSSQPGDTEVVGQVCRSRPRETGLAEGLILHVDGIKIDAVTAAENRLAVQLPRGR